jgi:hypothetical protein
MEVEQEATLLGWTPLEVFKGNRDKWIDAETFVERGKHIMPILKQNNAKLTGEIDNLKGQINGLQDSVKASLESMEALKEFHTEATKAQVAKARRDLLDELKQAKTDGDVDQEIEATAKLSAFDAGQVATKVQTPTPVSPPTIDPSVTAWMKENPWYGQDQIRTGMALGVGNKLRAEGDTRTGKEFLEAVAQVVQETLGEGSKTPASKVEGSRGGASSRNGGTDYASLPSDAREVCDRQAKKFVGPDRAFKTAKEWNTYFAEQYHQGN